MRFDPPLIFSKFCTICLRNEFNYSSLFQVKSEQVWLGAPNQHGLHVCRCRCHQNGNGGEEAPCLCPLCAFVRRFPIAGEMTSCYPHMNNLRALSSAQERQMVCGTAPMKYAAWLVACRLMCSCLACGADQSKYRFLSASLFRQNVPLCATKHVAESQGDSPVTATPLSCTRARGMAIPRRFNRMLGEVVL